MLSKSQAMAFHNVEGEALEQLRNQACALRDQHWGRQITYSRKVFVPLTNMCRDECGYCTFVKHPDSPEAQLMTPKQVMEIVTEGQRMGCKEVLLSFGEKPELRYQQAREKLATLGYQSMTDYAHDISKLIISKTDMLPHINAGTMTEREMSKLKKVSASMGMMLESVSRRLLNKGEAHYACPDKVPLQRLRTLERAGRQRVPFTTGILIGIGETWEERIDSLTAINEVHQRYGHIQEVIVQNFCAKPGTNMADALEPTLNDMLRTLAVARLILDPSISLQAPPNLQSRYRAYLDSGINDWGGISPLTIDHINPEKAWPQISQLETETRDCGYQLNERLAIYPSFQERSGVFLDSSISKIVKGLVDHEGLVSNPSDIRSTVDQCNQIPLQHL